MKYLVMLLSLVVLSACVPQALHVTSGRYIVLNAPAEQRAPGLADSLQASLSRQLAPDIGLVRRSVASYQENYRDMVRDRAPLQAAFAARSQAAEAAIMVGAPLLIRDVTVYRIGTFERREVYLRLQLQMQLIDATTAEVIMVFTGSRYEAVRNESTRQALVELQDDPDYQQLREQAIAELSPTLATALESRVAQIGN